MFGKSNNVIKHLNLSQNAKAAIGHSVTVLLNPGDHSAGRDLSKLLEERRLASQEVIQNPQDPHARTRLKQNNQALSGFLALIWGAGPEGTEINAETIAALPGVIGEADFQALVKQSAKSINDFYGNPE